MVDLLPFQSGINAAMSAVPEICQDPRTAFMNVLNAEGVKTPRTLQIGKIERLDSADDKRGKKSAWYIYQELEDSQNSGSIIGVASHGNWKTGEKHSWSSRSEHKMNIAERNNYIKAREVMRAQHELETKARQVEAAKTAYTIWFETKEADKHPYLTKKGVGVSTGLKIAKDGRLIIPVAVDNEITSLQFINGKGEKRFLTGGKIKGGWFLIEGEKDVIYIAEGYSTARSIHEATGKTVYTCFNAGNIYEVSTFVRNKHTRSQIIIAGDDDTGNEINVGRIKAEQAAQGLGVETIFPAGFNDFNDQHHHQGIKALAKYLNQEKLEAYESKVEENNQLTQRPSGALGDIYDYYNATSGNDQKGFAIQTALAVCGLILGRRYKTNLNNWTNLYLICVGKSATGKEHPKFMADKILYSSGLDHLIAGDGYTSAGAVFSTLLNKPNHMVSIDEFGRYLEASSNSGKGNSHQRESNTKLMEAIGRTNGIMKPPNYSTMTLKKSDAKTLEGKAIHNPSIIVLAITTPSTLFNVLDIGAVKDGFINRFIILNSKAKRKKRMPAPDLEVPQKIIDWAKTVTQRSNDADYCSSSSEPANPIILDFTEEALQAQRNFEQECLDKMDALETSGMSELVGRSNEMAMKISLICALSRDPMAEIIEKEDMEWAVSYVKHCQEDIMEALKLNISYSKFEANKKEILADLRERGSEGITWPAMQKTPPYSQHKPKDLKEIMQSLKEAYLAGDEPYQNPKGGKPTTRWLALKED